MAEYVNINDTEAENDVKTWIASVTGQTFKKNDSFSERLKSGVVLCELMNKIEPGIIPKIEDSKSHFKQMENIKKFLRACRLFGVKEYDVFETIDLYEEKVNLTTIKSCGPNSFDFSRIYGR